MPTTKNCCKFMPFIFNKFFASLHFRIQRERDNRAGLCFTHAEWIKYVSAFSWCSWTSPPSYRWRYDIHRCIYCTLCYVVNAFVFVESINFFSEKVFCKWAKIIYANKTEYSHELFRENPQHYITMVIYASVTFSVRRYQLFYIRISFYGLMISISWSTP